MSPARSRRLSESCQERGAAITHLGCVRGPRKKRYGSVRIRKGPARVRRRQSRNRCGGERGRKRRKQIKKTPHVKCGEVARSRRITTKHRRPRAPGQRSRWPGMGKAGVVAKRARNGLPAVVGPTDATSSCRLSSHHPTSCSSSFRNRPWSSADRRQMREQ